MALIARRRLQHVNRDTGRRAVPLRQQLSRGRATGGISVYIYPDKYPPKISPLKLFCALIAASDVRLVVYRTVVLCRKNLYPQNKFLSMSLQLSPLSLRGN